MHIIFMVVIKIYNILKCYWGRVKNERWRSICPKKISSKLQKYDFSHHMIKLETICQNLKKKIIVLMNQYDKNVFSLIFIYTYFDIYFFDELFVGTNQTTCYFIYFKDMVLSRIEDILMFFFAHWLYHHHHHNYHHYHHRLLKFWL